MPTEDYRLQQAVDHHQAGRLEQAAELYRSVLRGNPIQPDALYLLGVIAHQTENHQQAVELIRCALAIRSDQAQYHNVLGLALMSLGKADEAEAGFQRAIALDNAPEFHNNLGNLRKEQGRLDDAIAAYRQALKQNPRFADACYNLGNAHRAKHELEQAARCFRRVVNLDPAHGHAAAALGQVLQMLKRPEEALPFLRKAVSLLPNHADLLCDEGDASSSLGHFQDAAAAYRRALQLDPKLARAWYSAGCAENSQKEYVAAVACFRKAVEVSPDWPEARHNLGQALFQLGQANEALVELRRAVSGQHPELPRAMIAVAIPGCSGAGNQAVLDARREWAEHDLPPPRPAERFARRAGSGGRPLRIGYVSSFFHRRNWMKPVWALIDHHDRLHFEIHLFSDAPASAFEHGDRAHPAGTFHDTTGLSNEAVADSIEESGIDLLVDLNGYSEVRRLPLLALRPAPVIVGWFNMYATTGMSCYDYLIGDDEVIPPEEERFYCEKIVRVPGSYLTFEVAYPVPGVAAPPCLANRAITFGCLAPQYKITPEVVAAWSRILQQAPHSSLILKNTALASPGVRRFVHGLFAENHVSPERVRLDGPSEHYRFLQAYDEVDVALDTFPYNGGTTTTEAIWQGVPVVAFWGDRWVSRTSASILRAANLGRFVGRGLEDYVSLAVTMANSPATPETLAELRRNMRAQLRDSPVCDAQAFARNMERLYREMWAQLDISGC